MKMLSFKKKPGKTLFALSLASVLILSPFSTARAVAFKSAAEAIQTAQDTKQYLFLLCYDKKDDRSRAMESSAKSFKTGTAKSILYHAARATDEKEKDTVSKYGLDRAPLPVLLVFAPNGAVTAGFTGKVTDKDLKGSIVPAVIMDTLKTVQDGKIALVLLQNGKTKFNKESAKAAQEFSQDARLTGKVAVIKADPGALENADFLKNAGISKDMAESTVVMILPPGSIAGVYPGNIGKDTLVTALAACSSGSCGGGGCGSGSAGCGPGK